MDTETQSHVCPECDREFKSANALTAHSRVHKTDEQLGIDATKDRFVQQGEVFHVSPDYDDEDKPVDAIARLKAKSPKLRILRLPHYGDLPPPKRATVGSAGYDLHAAIPDTIWIGVGDRHPIPSGICLELPPTMYALCAPRSGLATKHGITLVNAPGIIDSDYRGEIICHLVNLSSTKFCVEPGMRIAQMVINTYNALDVEFVDALSQTARGTGGFGSTGA